MLGSAFFLLPSSWVELHSGNTYLANQGFGASLHDRTCDILIYGDSSAMIGIDPGILQRRTGLLACNIAETEGVTMVNHLLPVDDFLAHNPRPRIITFLYSPEDLYLPHPWRKNVSDFEGITYAVAHQPPAEAARLFATHPLETISWAETGLRMLAVHFHSRPVASSVLEQRNLTSGRFPMPPSARSSCDTSRNDEPPDPAFVAMLHKKYSVGGTRVLVDATPTAPCDPSLALYDERLNPLIDNAPYSTIPINALVNDGHIHVNAKGVILLSNMVADQILAVRRENR